MEGFKNSFEQMPEQVPTPPTPEEAREVSLSENVEKKSEVIPTPEEVRAVFEQLVGERKYEDRRKLEDEQGLYLWEIAIAETDGSTEYQYMRQGVHGKIRAAETVVNEVTFDSDGMPTGGAGSVAKMVNGKLEVGP